MSASLLGKRILIVGGTTGMGLSAARACIAAGARVYAVGKDAETTSDAQHELGRESIVVTADAMLPTTAQDAVNAMVMRWGGIDALYHVAGGSGRRWGDGPLDAVTDEGWDATLRLNLTSVMYSNRAVLRQLLAQGGGGSILNMASVLAWSPSPEHFATVAYATAKAGVIALSRAAAAQHLSEGIRINVLAPAVVETPMAQRALKDAAIVDFLKHKQPLAGGRAGLPEDLDAAVVWFLSDASRYCTGQVLAIDGGWTLRGTV